MTTMLQKARPRGVPPSPPPYRAYTLRNIRELPEYRLLDDDQRWAIEVVGRVLPFKTNSYVTTELIDWSDIPNDPIFVLNFPQRDMLRPEHFERVEHAFRRFGSGTPAFEAAVTEVRRELNPHPAGQLEHNIPDLYGESLRGMQHKYRETVLFFPSNGQTCHAYCTFCFRWPQFIGDNSLKFAMREAHFLVQYLRIHPEVTDVLFTGGDPLVMSTRNLRLYLEPLLDAELPNLQTIRIGTKALAYWPYRFISDGDAEELLALFRRITQRGLHLAVMAHFNHPRELSTAAAQEAIARVRATGAEIRTQSPVMRRINDAPEVWAQLWREQVRLGCVPYYMFIARDTGAQHYFAVPLVRAWSIFRDAYASVSGLGRTVRGPSMSADPGKVQVLGPAYVEGRRVLALQFLQARNPTWTLRPFFAEWDASACWLDELRPAFGEQEFFFEPEFRAMFGHRPRPGR